MLARGDRTLRDSGWLLIGNIFEVAIEVVILLKLLDLGLARCRMAGLSRSAEGQESLEP